MCRPRASSCLRTICRAGKHLGHQRRDPAGRRRAHHRGAQRLRLCAVGRREREPQPHRCRQRCPGELIRRGGLVQPGGGRGELRSRRRRGPAEIRIAESDEVRVHACHRTGVQSRVRDAGIAGVRTRPTRHPRRRTDLSVRGFASSDHGGADHRGGLHLQPAHRAEPDLAVGGKRRAGRAGAHDHHPAADRSFRATSRTERHQRLGECRGQHADRQERAQFPQCLGAAIRRHGGRGLPVAGRGHRGCGAVRRAA